jgi:TonB family protein
MVALTRASVVVTDRSSGGIAPALRVVATSKRQCESGAVKTRAGGRVRATARALAAACALCAGPLPWLDAAEVAAQAPPVYGDPGHGKPVGQDEPSAAPVVTMPELKQFVEAIYPPEAKAQGLEGTVELEIVIGPDGLVREAKVVTPAGHGFDEAALEAARKFTFVPATRDGQPIPARIRHNYLFEIREEAPPPPEPEAPPPPARLEGQIREAEGDDPLPGAEVTVTGGALTGPLRALTDAEGRFAFDDLRAGMYTVRVTAEGRVAREQEEELVAGEATSLTYRLAEPTDDEAFSAVARIPPPPREVTRRTIGKEALTRIAGTRGDALRTVELMPGVARPPLGAGVLIVRGSAPADTEVLFEGVPVPLLYHFGGLTSFINSRMIDSMEFYPGNFSVRYGRKRGGILEVKAAELPRELIGVADLNLVDASVLMQGPISENAEFGIAARRSYFDVIFEAALEEADIATVAAPVYYDYQAMATWRPDNSNKLRLMVLGSSDELALLFQEPSDEDAAVTGDFDVETQFHRAHASWRSKLSDKVDQDVDVSVGKDDIDLGLGEAFDFNLSGIDIFTRAEWRARVTEKVRLIGGIDLFFLPGEYTYIGPPPTGTENDPDSRGGAGLTNRDQITVRDDFVTVQPAAYTEFDINLQPWRVVLGSRVDYYEEIDAFSYDPRGSLHFTLSESTTLKGGIGIFSQPPEFYEAAPELGNPELDPTHTLHVSAGFEQQIGEQVNVGLEGFYKHMYDRVVGTENGVAPYFTNGGEGRVFGSELLVKIEPGGRFFGFLSYTLMRSERRDIGEDWTLFDFDQTHMLTASGVWRMGRGWELGGTFRFFSGNLDTPVIGSFYNVTGGQHSPVYGDVNSQRDPNFHRLDLRIEKLWKFSAWNLALYLDLQNAYNAENPEGQLCSYDFEECENVRGLPILPILGVRGEI